MTKKNSFLYSILYPVHLAAWTGLIAYLIYFDFTWTNLIQLLVGWIIIEGLGVAVVLHRYVSHKSFEARPGLTCSTPDQLSGTTG